MTTKLQKAAIVLNRFDRGWFHRSAWIAECVVGEGRSVGESSSRIPLSGSEMRRLLLEPATSALSGLVMECISTGGEMTHVDDPEVLF